MYSSPSWIIATTPQNWTRKTFGATIQSHWLYEFRRQSYSVGWTARISSACAAAVAAATIVNRFTKKDGDFISEHELGLQIKHLTRGYMFQRVSSELSFHLSWSGRLYTHSKNTVSASVHSDWIFCMPMAELFAVMSNIGETIKKLFTCGNTEVCVLFYVV
jgi:hypothetical protein